MKKNTIIILDATQAQVTKAFAKQARIFGTPEYREWRAFLAENPGTEMVTKTIKKKKDKKNDAKNRTYDKMAEYISLQENADALMKEFEAQKKLSIVQKSPYRFVLNWFLDTFPELKEDEDKKDDKKDRAKEKEVVIEEEPAKDFASSDGELVYSTSTEDDGDIDA